AWRRSSRRPRCSAFIVNQRGTEEGYRISPQRTPRTPRRWFFVSLVILVVQISWFSMFLRPPDRQMIALEAAGGASSRSRRVARVRRSDGRSGALLSERRTASGAGAPATAKAP